MVMFNNWLTKFLKINNCCLRAGLQHSAGWLSLNKTLKSICFSRESKFYTLVMLGHQRTLYLDQIIPLGWIISEAPFHVMRIPYPVRQGLHPKKEAKNIPYSLPLQLGCSHVTQAPPVRETRCSDVRGIPCGGSIMQVATAPSRVQMQVLAMSTVTSAAPWAPPAVLCPDLPSWKFILPPLSL